MACCCTFEALLFEWMRCQALTSWVCTESEVGPCLWSAAGIDTCWLPLPAPLL